MNLSSVPHILSENYGYSRTCIFFGSLQTNMLALGQRKEKKQTRGKLTSLNFFQSFVIKSEFKLCQLPRILKHNLIKKLYPVFCVSEIVLNMLFFCILL